LDLYSFGRRIIRPIGPLLLRRVLGRRWANLREFVCDWVKKLDAHTLNVSAELDNGRIVITGLNGEVTQDMFDQVES
jgi:hypothetical protein